MNETTPILFCPNYCTIAVGLMVGGVQKYNLYSPDCFNYFAAMLSVQNEVLVDIALDKSGYCGIIAAQLIGTEMCKPEDAHTPEEMTEKELFNLDTAVDISECSLNQMYDYVKEAIVILDKKLTAILNPTPNILH